MPIFAASIIFLVGDIVGHLIGVPNILLFSLLFLSVGGLLGDVWATHRESRRCSKCGSKPRLWARKQ